MKAAGLLPLASPETRAPANRCNGFSKKSVEIGLHFALPHRIPTRKQVVDWLTSFPRSSNSARKV